MVELDAETQVQAPVNIPADYVAGYENARQVASEMAANYVDHTLIGDPLGEAMAEDLAGLEPGESMRLIQAAMEQEGDEAGAERSGVNAGIFQGRGNPAGIA